MKLSTYLADKGLSASAFAREVGTAPSTITRLASGEIKPSFTLMQVIYEVTGGTVTPNDFADINA